MAKSKLSEAQLHQEIMDLATAHPSELKIPISIRLDSDIFMELRRRAKMGAGGGKYQRLLNDILRTVLFDVQAPHELDARHMAMQLKALSEKVEAMQRELAPKQKRKRA